MLSDQDKKELEEHLSKHYLLIPKKGSLAAIVAAIVAIFGLNYHIAVTTVSKVMAEEAVKKSKENILQTEKDVSNAQQRIAEIEHDLRATITKEVKAAKEKVEEIEGNTEKLAKSLSTTTFDCISAKRIALVDEHEQNRMLLTTSKDGHAALYLYDRHYKARMELYENNGSVGLNFLDRYGRGRMMLMMDSANGVPHLAVKNNEGKLLLELHENSGGTLDLQLKDRQGKNRIELTSGQTEGSYQLNFINGPITQRVP